MSARVSVWGDFDDLRSKDVRFLQEAARLGPLEVYLASDAALKAGRGARRFPEDERLYLIQSIRWVHSVRVVSWPLGSVLPVENAASAKSVWVVRESEDTAERRERSRIRGLDYRVIPEAILDGFPVDVDNASTTAPTVLVTGCFDWLHSGHVRFFEEASQLGRLVVVVGHDRNIRLLKGPGHPMQPADERRYMAASIRFVDQALISTGDGWLDAEPEIERLRPEVYVVNEDGDHPDKRAYCARERIRYVVLSRQPKAGLPRRTSTELRASHGGELPPAS